MQFFKYSLKMELEHATGYIRKDYIGYKAGFMLLDNILPL